LPTIQSVRIKKKKLIVVGLNFESPTEIYLNGEKQNKTSNDPDNPTTMVIAIKAGTLIPAGATVTVQVKNANTGNTSDEFIFTRPLE
jgi:hypothetical protein